MQVYWLKVLEKIFIFSKSLCFQKEQCVEKFIVADNDLIDLDSDSDIVFFQIN